MKRRLLILVVFLLAGAAVNVAVALACARWSPVECETLIDDARWCEGIGIQLTRISDERKQGQFHYLAHWRTAAGFPVLSLDGGLWEPKDSRVQRPNTHFRKLPVNIGEEALAAAEDRGQMLRVWARYTATILPLHPRWPGFAVNTIFYAAALGLLIPCPLALRRFIRRRRGLCPKCGYPMGESSICTECGKALPPRRAAT